MTSIGAATPVQSSNEAAPCASSTSRPDDDARSGSARGRSRGGLGIREVDERLVRCELDEHVVAFGRRVDDQIGIAHVGRPGAAA